MAGRPLGRDLGDRGRTEKSRANVLFITVVGETTAVVRGFPSLSSISGPNLIERLSFGESWNSLWFKKKIWRSWKGYWSSSRRFREDSKCKCFRNLTVHLQLERVFYLQTGSPLFHHQELRRMSPSGLFLLLRLRYQLPADLPANWKDSSIPKGQIISSEIHKRPRTQMCLFVQ